MTRPLGSAGAHVVAIMAGLVLLAPVSQSPATAHDLFLIPERAEPEPGATIRVGLHVSEVFPGEPIDWRPEKTREFFQVDLRGRTDLDGRTPSGHPLMPSLTVRTTGSTLVALVTEPSYIEIAAPAFRDYLKSEGHDDILQMRAKLHQGGSPGRERYRRWVKTLINAGGEASDVALKNLNLTIEIVPEAQPAAVRPGGSLPVRALFEGAPLAGGKLCATHAGYSTKPDTYAWCGRLDGAGRASVPIRAPGWQLLRITRMRALAGDARADWVSYWASLTFEVAQAGPSQAAALRRESR